MFRFQKRDKISLQTNEESDLYVYVTFILLTLFSVDADNSIPRISWDAVQSVSNKTCVFNLHNKILGLGNEQSHRHVITNPKCFLSGCVIFAMSMRTAADCTIDKQVDFIIRYFIFSINFSMCAVWIFVSSRLSVCVLIFQDCFSQLSTVTFIIQRVGIKK